MKDCLTTAAAFINRKNGGLIISAAKRHLHHVVPVNNPCMPKFPAMVNWKSVGTISPMNIQGVFLVIISVRFIIDDLIENLYAAYVPISDGNSR